MPTPNECLKQLDIEGLSDEELNDLIGPLLEARQRRIAEELLDGLRKDMKDTAEGLIKNLREEKVRRKAQLMQNVLIKQELMEIGTAAKNSVGDSALGIRAVLGGVNAPFVGNRRSIHSEGYGLFKTYLGAFFSKLEANNLMLAFNTRSIDDDIAKELWEVRHGRGIKTGNKEARGIAEIMDEIDRAKVAAENRAGAFIELRKARLTRTTHDPNYIRRNEMRWLEAARERFDWETMGVKEDNIDKVARDLYKGITTGVETTLRAADETDSIFTFTPGGNVAKRESARRRIVFKSAEDEIAYNKEFGYRTFREAWFSDMRRSSMNTVLMRRLGHNPERMLQDVRRSLATKFPDDTEKLQDKHIDNLFKVVTGITEIDSGKTIGGMSTADLTRVTRAMTDIFLLGDVAVNLPIDHAFSASFFRQMPEGGGFFQTLADAFKATYRGMADKNVKAWSKAAGFGYETMLGEVVQRIHSADALAGRMAEIQRLFFKWTGLGPGTDIQKRGVAHFVSARIGGETGKSFERLSADWKKWLGQYEIGEVEWALIQRTATKTENGAVVILPKDILELEDVPFEVRDKTAGKVAGLLADAADSAIPTPGAREKAFTTQGTQPGSLTGEVMRFAFHIRTFPITVVFRQVGSLTFGKGARTLQDALLKGQGDLVGLATMIASATALGMLSEQIRQVAAGKEPRPFDLSLLRDGFVRGGGAGIYTDLLFSETNRYGKTFTSILAGPAPAALGDRVFRIKDKLIAGEDATADMIRLARLMTPDFLYTKAALDYLVYYQLMEMTNPGYLDRMERGVKSDQGSKFFIPPSRVIPRGGGNRVFEGVR